MHAGDAWITVGGDAWPEWPDTQRPDMPQQHDTATVQVPSDVHDAFLEGCGGDHQAAESLLRKTLMAPSVAEAVNAAHQHVASNPSDDHFDAAKEGLSRAFCEFFERANQAEAMQMASLHMLALYTLRRKLRREVDGVMGRPAIIRNKAGEQLFFNERTAQFEPVPKNVLKTIRQTGGTFLGLNAHGKPMYLDRDELLREPASRSMRRSSAHRAPRSHPYADVDRCASLSEVGEKHFGAFWEFTEDVPVMSARQPRGSRGRGGYGRTNASSEGDGATFNGKSSKRTSTAAPTGREAANLSQVPVDGLPTPMFHGRCDAATANLPTVEEALRRSAEGETVVFADLADASPSKPQPRLVKRAPHKTKFFNTRILYAKYDSDTDLAEACAKVSLIRDSGGKKQSQNHTVEEDKNEGAAPTDEDPKVFDWKVCAQMVLASKTGGRRCDACDKLLVEPPITCLQYDVPYFTYCSESCLATCDVTKANTAHEPGRLPKKPAIDVKATAGCPRCVEGGVAKYEPLRRADKAMCTYGPSEVRLREVNAYRRVCNCGTVSLPSAIDFASKGLFPWICHTDGSELLWENGSFVFIETNLLQRFYRDRFESHLSVRALLQSQQAHTSDEEVSLASSSNVTAMNAALAQYGIGNVAVANLMQHPRANCLVCARGHRCINCDGSSGVENLAHPRHSAKDSPATALQPPRPTLLDMETVRQGIAADDLARKGAKTCRNPCHTLNFKANKHHSTETRVGGQKTRDFVHKKLFLSICSHFIVPIKGALFAEVHECHALLRLALRQVVGDESFQFFAQLENAGDTEAIQKFWLGLGYDVMCAVEVNLFAIMDELYGSIPKLAILKDIARLYIGGFHEHMHALECRLKMSQYTIPGAGLDLADAPESYFHFLRLFHNLFNKMGAMFMPSVEVLLSVTNTRYQAGLPKMLQDSLHLADTTLTKHVRILAGIRSCFKQFTERGSTAAFRTKVDEWAKSVTAITSHKDAKTKENIGWRPEHTLAEAEFRSDALKRYMTSKRTDDLLLALPIASQGAKIPKEGDKLQLKVRALQVEVERSLHRAERDAAADFKALAEYDDYNSDDFEDSWETSQKPRILAFASEQVDLARRQLPSLQLKRLSIAIAHNTAMYHACRDLAHSRDLNDKASSGQCTTFKTKTRARIACLVDAYNVWHRTLPPDIRGESHPLSVEACLSEDVSKQALANGAGALDAEHAPLPLILLSIRSTNKTKRAVEHRAIKTNEVCALHAELLDRIGELAIASKPLPAEIAGADSRLRWGWQRALLDERERLKRILNEWKGRFGKDAAFRIAAADINRRNAILDDSEVSG